MGVEQEHVKELARLVKAAQDAIKAAQDFADEHGLTFSFELDWHQYSYMGKGAMIESWEDSNRVSNGEWRSSSDSC